MGGRRALPRGLSRVVWRQAAGVVARLLDADGARRGGASVKTLTLAPGVAAKKVTHAVVCETLKHVPILKLVLADAGVALADDVVPNRRRRRAEDAERGERGEDSGEDDASGEEENESDGNDSLGDAREIAADDDDASVVPRSLAYVLGYESLFGAGLEADADDAAGPGPSGPEKRSDVAAVVAATRVVARARERLRAALKRRLKAGNHGSAEAFLLAQPGGKALAAVPTHSRHARVNLLKTDVAACELELKRRGLRPSRDPHVPDLLVFPPGCDLHDHAMVQDGRLILQGKSSCFPAAALDPQPGWTALDCCAAPGNKTTHLAARVGREGSVLAFDADKRRLRRLRENCANAGAMERAAPIVNAECGDFLALDPKDAKFARVRCVLLDPSCSGSGTAATRGDYLIAAARGEAVDVEAISLPGEDVGDLDKKEKARGSEGSGSGVKTKKAKKASSRDAAPPHVAAARARVASLARFQTEALRKALSFPFAERVSYSTCSVYPAENECVVAAVLPEAKRLGFQLERALPAWPRRGLRGHGLSDAEADALVRADQFEDDCEGFFVALFSRPTPPGAEKAAAAAAAAEAKAREDLEAARAKKRADADGGGGVRPVYRAGTKKRKKGAAGPLFR